MTETLIEMLDDRLPEDIAIFAEGPQSQLLGEGVPEERRVLIYIQKRIPYDENNASNNYSLEDSENVITLTSNGRERCVTLDIDQRKPLSEKTKQEYVDLTKALLSIF
jgi:hypothetical protein